MQCNKSHFGKPYQDTLTRLLGNSKKTKTNSLWIVLNYAMWNSLISIIDIWFRIRFPWFRFWIPYFSATMIFWNQFFCCPHENAIVTENATSLRLCPVADQKGRGLWEQDCTKGTPGNSRGRGCLWYWEHAHSLLSAIFGLILAPRATRLYFYHFIKYLVPQRTLGKQRKDIYFEIKARSKCFEITLIARAYILLRNDLSPL